MGEERSVKFFRNGRNQAVRIPREFEMPGEGGIMRKEGDCLIIQPERRRTIGEVLDWLAAQPPLAPEDDLPEIEDPAPEAVTDFDDWSDD
jgi:antitoxin VapB